MSHCESRIGHGALCECRSLALAAQGGADAVPFSYCRHVLQRRYRMVCRHGDSAFEPTMPMPHLEMPVAADPVKAILLGNALICERSLAAGLKPLEAISRTL